ncbi:MAG TPA: HEPN domain-containing protein [Coriobacteriia bacterium]
MAFGKTHDLERLVSLAASVDGGFETLADAAETLAPFAVEIRYPGDWDELSRDEYSEVKDAAKEIVAFTADRIDAEG